MFEVGFSELLVIFVLALIVLGPEKLPRLASQVGRWIGRARAMAKQFRDQLEEEVNVAESNKWKPAPTPEPAPSAEPPPATAAESGTPPPDLHPAPNHDLGEPHTNEMHAGAHNSGPPAEPEASVYEPPAYSSPGSSPSAASPANASPSTASPAPAPNGAPTDKPHDPAHPHATSEDPPLRPGDVVTTTHERGI